MSKANIIPYGKQFISEADIRAVADALTKDYLTVGPIVEAFEQAFARYVHADFAVAVANGTAALHLCALALGVGPESRVITTPITFAASANCIRFCQGTVDFVDIDPATYLMDLDALEAKLASKPKGYYQGIIPVHFAGRCVDMERVKSLALSYGTWIIEDACHAPGAYFLDAQGNKQYAGNGNFADLAIFSFHPVKHIATGEGGMVTSKDPDLFDKVKHLRTHGIQRDPSKFSNSVALAGGEGNQYPGWYMEMQDLGYNYRFTEFQSALGLSQLQRAEQGLERRRCLAERYEKAFRGADWLLGQSGVHQGHAYHLFVLEVKNRLGLYNFLRSHGVFAQIHYFPCHLMPYYQTFGWKEGDFPKAENYYKNCISLPLFPSLKDEEQDLVISLIHSFYE